MEEIIYKKINKLIARTLRTPAYLILFVTDKCRMKCGHCWFNEEWKKNNLSGGVLSFEELEKLAESIGAIRFLSLTGGEAFMRDDIVDIGELFAAKTKLSRYQIPTSGFDTDKITRDTESLLKRLPGIPFRVDISLDGPEEIHDEIRNRKGSFTAAVKTISELVKIKKHFDYFDLGIITTISNKNQNLLEEMAKIIEEINPGGEWMVNITRGDPRDSEAANTDVNRYIEAHEIIRRSVADGKMGSHSGHADAKLLTAKNIVRRKTIIDIINGKGKGGACAAGSAGGVIYPDGSVYPCEMLNKSFGNLRDYNYSLPGIWNSPKADEIRDYIEESKCICTQECFLSISLLIRPGAVARILKERMKMFL